MENSDDIKVERLDRIITVRMTDKDYKALVGISEKKRTNVSGIIRKMICTIADLVKENNCKDK